MDAEQSPSLEQWRSLYALADKVKQMQPWQWMEESDIFGVQIPHTDTTVFVSVMGMAGEHRAVSLYRSVGSLFMLWDFMDNAEFLSPLDLLMIPQVQLAFEDRNQLMDEDLKVIRQLKLKFKGSQNWVTFRDFRPGYLPWYITAADVPLLTHALEQLLELAPRFKADARVLYPDAPEDFFQQRQSEYEAMKSIQPLDFDTLSGSMQDMIRQMFDEMSDEEIDAMIDNQDAADPELLAMDALADADVDADDDPFLRDDVADVERMLIRVPTVSADNAPITWRDEQRDLLLPEPKLLEIVYDSELVKQVEKQRKTRQILEMALEIVPSPITEPDSRPYFGFILLGADARQGMVLIQEMVFPVPDITAMYQTIPNQFLLALQKMGIRPGTIRVGNGTMPDLLAPLTSQLKIKLEIVDELPMVDAAIYGMNMIMNSGIDPDELSRMLEEYAG